MKKRDLNIDLLKVTVLYLIIIGHFINHSGILNCVSDFSVFGVVTWTLKALVCISVNVFIFITGYYSVNIEFKISKFINLIVTVWTLSVFSSVIGYIITKCLGGTLEIITLIKGFFPLFTNLYWFITAYLVLYLLFGYINKIVSNSSKRELQFLLLISFIVFSCWCSIWPKSLDTTGGFGIIWFIVLYLTGAYIRVYEINILKKRNCMIVIFIIYLIIMVGIKYFSLKISSTILPTFSQKVNAVMFKYNFPLVYIASVIFFGIFLYGIKIPDKRKMLWIRFFSKNTLGIYLIHENPLIRELIWGHINLNLIQKNIVVYIFFIIVLCAMVFVACSLIEQGRKLLFNVCRIDYLVDKISNYLERCVNKIQNEE